MLLLAQHERETIILETSDGPIEVRLTRLDDHEARIGIDAPSTVRIIRREDAPATPSLPHRAEAQDEPWWSHPDDKAADSGAGIVAFDWDADSLD